MTQAIEIIEEILTTDIGQAKPVFLTQTAESCFVCISHKVKNDGYLRLCRDGKSIASHRMVYENFYGPIPEGLCVCHTCDNPGCQNPMHFFTGTVADNNRDKAKKGRGVVGNTWSQGEKSVKAKLTAEMVINIRRKHSTGEYTLEQLAQESGVDSSNIHLIVRGKRWKHLLA